jgi:hypothetical protein
MTTDGHAGREGKKTEGKKTTGNKRQHKQPNKQKNRSLFASVLTRNAPLFFSLLIRSTWITNFLRYTWVTLPSRE